VNGGELGKRILLDAIDRLPEGLPAAWLVGRGRVGQQLASIARDQGCSAIVIGAAADRRMRIRLFPSVLRQLQAWTDLPINEGERLHTAETGRRKTRPRPSVIGRVCPQRISAPPSTTIT
jgi:hypothetical protein